MRLLESIPATVGQRWDTPWMDRQSIARHSVEYFCSLINSNCFFGSYILLPVGDAAAPCHPYFAFSQDVTHKTNQIELD